MSFDNIVNIFSRRVKTYRHVVRTTVANDREARPAGRAERARLCYTVPNTGVPRPPAYPNRFGCSLVSRLVRLSNCHLILGALSYALDRAP